MVKLIVTARYGRKYMPIKKEFDLNDYHSFEEYIRTLFIDDLLKSFSVRVISSKKRG